MVKDGPPLKKKIEEKLPWLGRVYSKQGPRVKIGPKEGGQWFKDKAS